MKSVGSAKKRRTTRKKKVGIFGGSFNPLHMGHINSLVTVWEKVGLSKILVIPSFQSPGKAFIESPTPDQRLEMTQAGLSDYSEFVEVDGREIQRGGTSYTCDTLEELGAEQPNLEFSLIMGGDAFLTLGTWKNVSDLLEKVDLIVTTRPGSDLPFRKDDLPEDLQPHFAELDRNGGALTSGKQMTYVPLEDVEISATEIRKSVRAGLHVEKYVNYPVQEYIDTHGLYKSGGVKINNYRDFAKFCGGVLWEKKAIDVVGYDLTSVSAPSEYAIICSGTSTRHTTSLAEAVVEEARRHFGINPLSREGRDVGNWVLLDYGGLIIHVFYDFIRSQYNLEKVWPGFKSLEISEPKASPRSPDAPAR